MRAPFEHPSLPVRGPAALTASVLALSGVLSPIALAEQDQNDDGTAAVTQNAGTDPDQGAALDPGGQPAALPDAPTAAPAPSVAPATTAQPADQTDPVVDAGDGSDAQGASPQPPAASAGAPADAATTVAATQPAPPSVDAAAPATVPADPGPAPETSAAPLPAPAAAPTPQRLVASSRKARKIGPVHRRMRRHRVERSHAVPAATVPATPVTVVPPARAATVKPVTIPVALRAKPGDRTHVVRPGESLWMIATDLLGSHATSTAVAREVRLLWSDNRARIGTGDPNVLLIGTKLALPTTEER